MFGSNPQSNTGTFLNAAQQSSGLFGSQQPTSAGLFGTTSGQSTGLFGSQAPSSNSATGGLFGSFAPAAQQQQPTSLFGGQQPQQQQQQSTSLFGSQQPQQQQQSTSLFGGQQPQQQQQSTSLFGGQQPQQQQSTSLFGSQQPQQQQSTSLFGSQQPQQQQSTSLFGSQQPQQQQSTSLFGSQQPQQQQSTGLFGQAGQAGTGLLSSTSPTTSIFGNAAGQPQQSSLFGTTSQQNTTTPTSIFGQASSSMTSPSTQAPGASLFGGSGSSLFAPTTATNTGTGGLFGSQQMGGQEHTSSLFGTGLSQPTTGPSMSSNLFGSILNKPASSGPVNIFGNQLPLGGTSTTPIGSQMGSAIEALKKQLALVGIDGTTLPLIVQQMLTVIANPNLKTAHVLVEIVDRVQQLQAVSTGAEFVGFAHNKAQTQTEAQQLQLLCDQQMANCPPPVARKYLKAKKDVPSSMYYTDPIIGFLGIEARMKRQREYLDHVMSISEKLREKQTAIQQELSVDILRRVDELQKRHLRLQQRTHSVITMLEVFTNSIQKVEYKHSMVKQISNECRKLEERLCSGNDNILLQGAKLHFRVKSLKNRLEYEGALMEEDELLCIADTGENFLSRQSVSESKPSRDDVQKRVAALVETAEKNSNTLCIIEEKLQSTANNLQLMKSRVVPR